MYPDLSYLFHDLLGTPYDNWLSVFKTFGFFLALSFLLSAYVYYLELRRKSKENTFFTPIVEKVIEGKPVAAAFPEILSNALIGFLLFGKGGLAIQDSAAFAKDPADVVLSLNFHWVYGLLGALLLGGLAFWDAKRKALPEPIEKNVNFWPHHRISEFTVWAAIGGVAGAKLFDLFDNWSDFIQDPIGMLFSGGGLAFFGGLILGFIAVVWYQRRKKIPFLPSADAVAPALVAGYGLGRVGCQLSGDGDWGIPITPPKPGWMSFLPDWLWGYQYPHTVLGDATVHTGPAMKIDAMTAIRMEGFSGRYPFMLEQPVYPTPLYEIMMMSVIFAILWSLRRRFAQPGMIFFLYLSLIAVERFLIEFIRVNVQYDVFGMSLSQAQLIAIGLFVVGLGGMFYLKKKGSAAA